jgi:hypothetical protein
VIEQGNYRQFKQSILKVLDTVKCCVCSHDALVRPAAVSLKIFSSGTYIDAVDCPDCIRHFVPQVVTLAGSETIVIFKERTL